ncbi:unnamed protein product [Ranitomeya imitator]|uniref:Uncharacterized protein n=1 Tax=Ranitomeya imitator TaxID=111125 RepID=A0ABN9LX93_9NEOB|nr:unnamed protein product [Ranitomeya imitator]
MELSGVQWSKVQDMCQVLQCFKECTRLVSADNAIISMSIPLMRLLMQSLMHIKEQASIAEEEESLDDSQPLSGQGSVQDEVAGEQEEEEDEEDDGDEETSDVDLPETAPQPSTTADLTTGTLAHMADYALRILKRDPRIIKMMTDDDYWLACLLDPRYKGKLQNIMPHENLEQILATKQSTLVDRLIQAFPAHSDGSVPTHYHTRLRPHTLPHEAPSPHITTRGSIPTHYHTKLRPHTLPHDAPFSHITTRDSIPRHYHMRLCPHTLPHEAPSPQITSRGSVPPHYHTRLCPHTLPHEALSPHITTH